MPPTNQHGIQGMLSRHQGQGAYLLCVMGRGSDPAARAAVAAFVQGPLAAAEAAYNITAGQAALVQGYLLDIIISVVAPLYRDRVLGPPLGARSGRPGGGAQRGGLAVWCAAHRTAPR